MDQLTTFLDGEFPTRLSQPDEGLVDITKSASKLLMYRFRPQRNEAQEMAMLARAYIQAGNIAKATEKAVGACYYKERIRLEKVYLDQGLPMDDLEEISDPTVAAFLKEAEESAVKVWKKYGLPE